MEMLSMARTVSKQIQAVTRTYTEWEFGAVTGGGISTLQSMYEIYNLRSDVVKGNHIDPLPYVAKFYHCEPQEFRKVFPWSTTRTFGPGGKLQRNRRIVVGTKAPTYSRYGEKDIAIDSDFPEWTMRSARAKVLEDLVRSEVDLGQFFGEGRESLALIAGTAIKVLQAYRALRKGNFSAIPKLLGVKKPSSLPKATADLWFSYKFGWQPMLQDIYNAKEAVNRQLNRKTFAKALGVTVTSQLVTQGTSSNTITPGKVTKGSEVGVSYRIDDHTLAGLNSLGLVNPAKIAWELVPLSFVVDWFIPIGSFLSQLSAPLGCTFVHGYETRFAYGNMRIVRAESGEGSDPAWHVTGFGMSRVAIHAFPMPTIVVDLGLNVNQVLTLLGLIAQRA
jgi:hypothetical protein